MNNEFNGFDWDSVDSSAQDAMQFSAPVVFWRHGQEEMEQAGGVNYTGGFFFTYEQAGEQAEIPGWEPSWFRGDNGRVDGLAAKGARISIVRSRKRWFKDDGGRMAYRAWNSYAEGYRGQMQSIGFINGYNVPVCFAFKGMLITHIEEALRYHTSKVVSLANQKAPEGKRMPPYALWMAVQSGKHETIGQGKKTSEVTMPELWLPKTVDIEYARKMYVGGEQLVQSQNLYRELESWAHEWDKFTVVPEPDESEPGKPKDELEGAQQYAQRQEAQRAGKARYVPTQDEDDSVPF